MSALLGYRAELANQVIVRLKRLSEPQWLRAVAVLDGRREYFDLAYQLSSHAIGIMVEEAGDESCTLLRARLGDIDAEFSVAAATTVSPETQMLRCLIGRAAVLAVFLRDSHGFNLGGFQELYAPVAECLSLSEIEATAAASISPHADDFKTAAQAPAIVDRDAERRKRA